MQQLLSDQLYRNAIQANFSHEFSTPLNSIISNAQVLINELSDLQRVLTAEEDLENLI
jgi:signal transduction histidine kinase